MWLAGGYDEESKIPCDSALGVAPRRDGPGTSYLRHAEFLTVRVLQPIPGIVQE